ncbi:39S ribosomal protein L50 like protein [Argiope bruennichi]|uniref:Large ribosomal subunit protein mL50 n=1 Tax=Argiope bruennichi TaxID=94029 RepID=A0A8T0FCN9_ARGBR|nr:39S ribosomal protein L50 like protein [Argiope bruennichi]
MNSLKICGIFKDYLSAAQNVQKILSANACLNVGKGTRLLKKVRKYRRPEDLEDPLYYGKGPKKEVQTALQAIADRGFARELPPYKPSTDLDEQLHKICKKIFGPDLSSAWKQQSLSDSLMKYKVLTKCIETFRKDVPNSSLHKMKTIEDVFTYYNTPVDGCLPYDAMVRDSEALPPNLYVMPEIPTFNPATDSFFDGILLHFPVARELFILRLEKNLKKL